jgi:hypothetical protein
MRSRRAYLVAKREIIRIRGRMYKKREKGFDSIAIVDKKSMCCGSDLLS